MVSGDEPLLVGEAADAIRAAARAAGYADRQVFFIDRSFNWDELRLASQSLSLFAERRLFELRMPSGKPDKGAALLADLAAQSAPDLTFLIITDKLDRKVSDAPWVQAIEKHGAWVPILPVEAAALPGWLRARAKALHLEIDPEASQLIVDRVEGNLLAAQQELEKLGLLANGEPIGAELVLRSVGDSARYDVFQLAEAAAAGDAARALRVLLGLKSEGVEPTLILGRCCGSCVECGRRVNATGCGPRRAAAAGTWPRIHRRRALARLKKLPLAPLLLQASHTDRVIKGLAPGDAWSALTGLTGALAGALQAGGI